MFQIKIHVFYYNFEVKHFSFILLSNVYGRKSVTLKHFLISCLNENSPVSALNCSVLIAPESQDTAWCG